VLRPTDAAIILEFFRSHSGVTPFLYTPSDEADPVQWKCKEWSDRRGNGGFRSISATFTQDFSLVS